MAIVSSQPTRTSGRSQNYAKKGAVAISALNAAVPMFDQRLAEVRTLHGKDGMQSRCAVDEDGKTVHDAVGRTVLLLDAKAGRYTRQSVAKRQDANGAKLGVRLKCPLRSAILNYQFSTQHQTKFCSCLNATETRILQLLLCHHFYVIIYSNLETLYKFGFIFL